MKSLTDMTEADQRSLGFVVANMAEGTIRPMALADLYRDAERIQITEAVPEDIRSYMQATKTLFTYGWFYYPFFTFSAFMATTAVEMALKLRLQSRPGDPSSLKGLFDQAMRDGLLSDEGFPSREAFRLEPIGFAGVSEQSARSVSSDTAPSYTERVARLMRYFRNTFAHPRAHWIILPGQALELLTLAAEVMNQLWRSV